MQPLTAIRPSPRIANLKAAPLIWINGFPGSGKLTVSKALIRVYREEQPILIDNHQLIDPVEAKIPRDHPEYQQQRQLERSKAFAKYVDGTAMCSRIIVFTGEFDLFCIEYSTTSFVNQYEIKFV